MYSPLNEALMFQDMHERTARMRAARPAATPAATGWSRAGVADRAAEDTRRWWRRATHRAR